MRKIFWAVVVIPLALVILVVVLSGYYVHNLSFNKRVMCAVGEPTFLFLPPVCRSYISAFYSGDTVEDRREMAASFGFLVSGYVLNKGSDRATKALQLADLFVSRGADVNAVNPRGYTPLHEVVLAGEPVLVKFFLQHGADPNKRTVIPSIGETLSPLELARKLHEEGNSYGDFDWQGIISLLESHRQNASS